MTKNNIYAYIAGLFDGEGSVFIIATHEKSLKKMRLRPTIKICQQHREVLDYVKKHLGFGYVCHASSKKRVWVYQIQTSRSVKRFCECITQYSFIKKRPLKLVYEFTKLCHKGGKFPYTKATRKRMVELRELIHQCNLHTKARVAVQKFSKEQVSEQDFEVLW